MSLFFIYTGNGAVQIDTDSVIKLISINITVPLPLLTSLLYSYWLNSENDPVCLFQI